MVMNPLRQKMIEHMQLRGLSEKTQDAYVRVVRQLAEHCDKSPDLVSEEELRLFFLYLKNGKQVSSSTLTVALCGLKFFYEHTLRREWVTLDLVRPARKKEVARGAQHRSGTPHPGAHPPPALSSLPEQHQLFLVRDASAVGSRLGQRLTSLD
jgi:hypothetical protein